MRAARTGQLRRQLDANEGILMRRLVRQQIEGQRMQRVARQDRRRLAEGPMDREFATPDVKTEEHTSELQSLMRISYAVFCLKKKKKTNNEQTITLPTPNILHYTATTTTTANRTESK